MPKQQRQPAKMLDISIPIKCPQSIQWCGSISRDELSQILHDSVLSLDKQTLVENAVIAGGQGKDSFSCQNLSTPPQSSLNRVHRAIEDYRRLIGHETFSQSIVHPHQMSWFEEYVPNPIELAQAYLDWQTHSTPAQAAKDAAKGFIYAASAAGYVAGWLVSPLAMSTLHAGGLTAVACSESEVSPKEQILGQKPSQDGGMIRNVGPQADGGVRIDGGVADELSARKIGEDVRIVNEDNHPGEPSLVWTGSEFGVSWSFSKHGAKNIRLTRLGASGNKIGDDLFITNTNNGYYTADGELHHSMVWTGSEYGVTWLWTDDMYRSTGIYLARIDASGNKIGGDVQIADNPARNILPSLVWTGSEYGISWTGRVVDPVVFNEEIYFARITANGNKIGENVRVTNALGVSGEPSLAWMGNGYGVSWLDYRDSNLSEIYFARLDSQGNKIGGDVQITNTSLIKKQPVLIWTGSEYGVCWRGRRIYFARVTADGNKIGNDVSITDNIGHSSRPSLVWTGSEYGVSWSDRRGGKYRVYFARIDAEGNRIGRDLQVSDDIYWSHGPSLVWTGSEYGLSWQSKNDEDGVNSLYFTRIQPLE